MIMHFSSKSHKDPSRSFLRTIQSHPIPERRQASGHPFSRSRIVPTHLSLHPTHEKIRRSLCIASVGIPTVRSASLVIPLSGGREANVFEVPIRHETSLLGSTSLHSGSYRISFASSTSSTEGILSRGRIPSSVYLVGSESFGYLSQIEYTSRISRSFCVLGTAHKKSYCQYTQQRDDHHDFDKGEGLFSRETVFGYT